MVATAISQRLLEKNPLASILILEAGGRIKTKDFSVWEQYLITGRLPYEVCRDLDYPQRDAPGENASVGTTPIPLIGARLFVYGGSTMHWGGWSFRLKPEDFRLNSNAKEGGDWPIDYDALEPYYSQAETYLAVSGDSSDRTVPRRSEYPFRPFPFTLQDQPLIGALQKLKYAYGNLPIARRGVYGVPSRHAPCQTTGLANIVPLAPVMSRATISMTFGNGMITQTSRSDLEVPLSQLRSQASNEHPAWFTPTRVRGSRSR